MCCEASVGDIATVHVATLVPGLPLTGFGDAGEELVQTAGAPFSVKATVPLPSGAAWVLLASVIVAVTVMGTPTYGSFWAALTDTAVDVAAGVIV